MNKTQAELFHESAFAAEKFILPQEMAADFVVIELLSENDLGSTFLLSKRADGSKYVLKCYRKSETEGIGKESEIMRGLSHIGLPSFEADYDDGEAVFVLREFAQGISLDDYLEENTRIEPALTVKIISALCDTLSYLHSQPAPIIHRDVKPSNIIINLSDNSVKLIDFGISRTYTEGAKNDTQQYGTKPFSAPEQYGFAQTDSRSDLYSVGVVMRFMLTGDTNGQIQDKNLAAIVGKCTAFDPDNRYQSADALKRALIRYKNYKKIIIVRSIACAAALCLLVAACFYVGKYTDFFRSPNAEISGETEYVFSDPLVEQSVRAALGKADGETVTWDELKGVTSLWFLGGYAVNNSQQYWQYNETFDPSPIYADLKDLSDLENCAELSELIINGQTIEDVSALASCYKLRKLHLVNCPNLGDISALASLNTLEEFDAVKCDISDLTPLVHLPLLRALTVIQLPLSDYSAFERMKNLRQLQVRQIPLQSITELGNLTQMEELTLRDTLIDTLDGIESFGALTKLTLENGEGVRDFSPLNNLPELRELEISADSVPRVAATMSNKDIMVRVIGSNDLLPLEDTAVSFTEPLVEQSVRAMLGMTEGETVTWGDLKDVTELYFLGNDAVTNKEGVERLMRQYDEAQITPSGSLNDLSDFKNMENLRKLVIIGQPVEDLSLLADCPGLFELDLHVCPQLRDISALTQCLQLENLHLLATGVSDLSPLTELPRLNTLRLTRNLDMNFSAVENMDTLRHLVIAQVPLWSLSELGALPRITALELRDVQLDSLNGIENFTALSSLILQRTGNIRDFSPINNLPDLRELTIPVDMELDAAATITRDDVQITLIN